MTLPLICKPMFSPSLLLIIRLFFLSLIEEVGMAELKGWGCRMSSQFEHMCRGESSVK